MYKYMNHSAHNSTLGGDEDKDIMYQHHTVLERLHSG